MKSVYTVEKTCSIVLEVGRVIDPKTGLDAIRNATINNGEIVAISNHQLISKDPIELKLGSHPLHTYGDDTVKQPRTHFGSSVEHLPGKNGPGGSLIPH